MKTERSTTRGVPRGGGRAVTADDERLRAFRQAFADHVELPTSASVLDEPVTVISLASPLTVRVVLATGPVLIFFVQLIEARLSASPYSLAAALLYAGVAISAGLARQHAIRSADRLAPLT